MTISSIPGFPSRMVLHTGLTSQVSAATGYNRRSAAAAGSAWTMSPRELGLMISRRLTSLKNKDILLLKNPPDRARQIASHVIRRKAPLGHPRLLLFWHIPAPDKDRECSNIPRQLHIASFVADHDGIFGGYAQLSLCALHQAGRGLAAGASFVWAMRTDKDPVQPRALLRKQLSQPLVNRLQLVLRDEPARQP